MNLTWWLENYRILDKNIVLCYRPTLKSWWGNRCIYKGEEYDKKIKYNHRKILKQEIIIEFDEDDKRLNKKYAVEVSKRLKKDNIGYAMWFSGNKSTHLHTMVRIKDVRNLRLLKKTFIRYYTKGLPLPDLRMAVPNHLIRAEYGINEKSGNKKTFIEKTVGYPFIYKIPEDVWDKYNKGYRTVLKRKLTTNINYLIDHPAFKYVLSSEKFRLNDDGRERALFMLIHVLKPNYKDKKQELVKFLQDWYKYSSGRKLNDRDIQNKVNYHWSRRYHFGEDYIRELFEDIGLDMDKVVKEMKNK